jgi:hypothetical protein
MLVFACDKKYDGKRTVLLGRTRRKFGEKGSEDIEKANVIVFEIRGGHSCAVRCCCCGTNIGRARVARSVVITSERAFLLVIKSASESLRS